LLGVEGTMLCADCCRRLVTEREREKRESICSNDRNGAAARRSMGSSRPPLFWGYVADTLLLGWLRGQDMDLPMVTPASTCLLALDEARGCRARRTVRVPVCCGSCGGFAGRLLIGRERHLKRDPVDRGRLLVPFVHLLRCRILREVHNNDIYRKHCFCPKEQEERSVAGRGVGCRSRTPKD
jgi:hypothetical protein